MTRGQRILLVVGLVGLSWFLHVQLCEWRMKTTGTAIVGVVHGQRTPPGRRQRPQDLYTGLFPNNDVSSGLAVIGGVAVPFVLLGSACFLLLGWRHAARVHRGLCPKCSYDLTGGEDRSRCPECGWTTSPT